MLVDISIKTFRKLIKFDDAEITESLNFNAYITWVIVI